MLTNSEWVRPAISWQLWIKNLVINRNPLERISYCKWSFMQYRDRVPFRPEVKRELLWFFNAIFPFGTQNISFPSLLHFFYYWLCTGFYVLWLPYRSVFMCRYFPHNPLRAAIRGLLRKPTINRQYWIFSSCMFAYKTELEKSYD